MRILGLETSADDTGIALIDAEGNFGSAFECKILANERISQSGHEAYGGIYPNLAKEEHKKNLPIAFEKAMQGNSKPDLIAVTVGPGLEPCLWTGITFAQRLASEWNLPVVPVNHMEGHIIISAVMGENESTKFQVTSTKQVEFPALALLISGGHTELILMKDPPAGGGQYEYIGRTRDDAVGEAFDKVARLLELGYPGGPEISRLAKEAREKNIVVDFELPRPMLHEDNFDFSFAGLKTAVRRIVENPPVGRKLNHEVKLQIAREFEDAVADVLVAKTVRAVDECGVNTVVLGGGVSANTHIRTLLNSKLSNINCKLLVCPPEFSTDNALMIALAGYFHALKKEFADPALLSAKGNLKLA